MASTNAPQSLRTRLDDLAAWLGENPGRRPSAYHDRDERERSLAYFLTRTRRADAAGRGNPALLEGLDTVLPGWRISLKSPEHWDERLAVAHQQADASTRVPPRFPDFKSDDQAIRSTASWALASWRGPEYGMAADPSRRTRLERVRGWTEPRHFGKPGQGNDLERLRRHAQEAAEFDAAHGRPPSQTGTEPGEPRLGQWLSWQRSAMKRGDAAWNEEREAILDEAYPAWRGKVDRYDWNATLTKVVRYRTRHGHLPSSGHLCRWLLKRRYEARTGAPNLTAERLARLDACLPGWRA